MHVLGIINRFFEETGIRILRWFFSESQIGKDGPDQKLAQIKGRAYNYVDSGHDINTPKDLFNATNFGNILKGISLYLCQSEHPFDGKYIIPCIIIVILFSKFPNKVLKFEHISILKLEREKLSM